ncbi:Bifunctional inhibitor/lipid-transfer protein/seed storage 2S albumin superfamily protein [Rhynchospora pubera]|uniref:Bifunctional inhibitor/lipid-transfer protein/seed storage 2S albumin superfamily protein n=1 Tax=Rhynchospora pubera TaxID=906938 RepID=A0AAV8HM74_9POAL|nr:Bifunctional inhibitor/lipid-transfer protein/seed storage 2S albumin superfamily protein [Rhynchospora pubera]KAJ4815942.1 Bifunctional inhibitor/lipid-transfer protein/seed storage 2S albumin superfamily protein [Rhynchospora pubera]
MKNHLPLSILPVTLTLVLFSLLISSNACPYCPTPVPPTKPSHPPPSPKPHPPPPPPPSPPPPSPKPCPPPPPPPSPKPCPPPPPPPSPPPPSVPKPCPPPPPTNNQGSCPINALKLDACVDLLGGLVHIGIGSQVKDTCCPVLEGIADLDAAACLCTAIQAKVLNLKVILPIALEVLVDCGKHVPSDYQCPS